MVNVLQLSASSHETNEGSQHGGKRSRLSADQLDARRQKEQTKLQEYLKLTDDVLNRVISGFW